MLMFLLNKVNSVDIKIPSVFFDCTIEVKNN